MSSGLQPNHRSLRDISLPLRLILMRADEIVWIQSMATGARIYGRAGGLKNSDVHGKDGRK